MRPGLGRYFFYKCIGRRTVDCHGCTVPPQTAFANRGCLAHDALVDLAQGSFNVAEPTFDIAKLWTDLGIGGFSALIAAVSTCVGIAVYVTRAYTQAKIDRLEGDVSREKERHAAEIEQQEGRYRDLDARHEEIRRAGSVLYM